MMQDGEMLARLVAQAEAGRGGDLLTLRALVEEASEMGAARALERLGLADPHAARDMAELRALLGGWRDARRAAGKAAIGWAARAALALMLAGMAASLGLIALVKGG